MKILLAAFFAIFSLASISAHAGTPIINLSIGGEISPGVYGQVQFGNAPPPEVINVQPMMVIPEESGAMLEPIYLHVPPGHAKHWARYCHRYNACNRPVYFVKSGRYQPDYRNDRHEGYRNEDRGDGGHEDGDRGEREDRGHDRGNRGRDRED